MDEQEIQDLIASTPLAWITLNEFVSENQKPLEFSNHRFLIQPISDLHPDQVYLKSAQVGMSTVSILKVMWLAKYKDMNVIYVLPTKNISDEFVMPKVNPIIESNPSIKSIVETDSRGLKQIGKRFIYFNGAFSESAAIMKSADVLILDELDRMPNMNIVNMFDSRLQASEYAWRWRLSNPSTPGYGIHELYEQSCQYHWFVTCHACKHEWYMSFEPSDDNTHYVDQEKEIFACGNCQVEISDDDRRGGRWVAKYPSREKFRHGYWMSQLIAPWVSAARIMEQYRESNTEFFYNFVLGLPYQAADLLIDRASILNANFPAEPRLQNVVMGSDIGKPHWYWLGTPSGVFRCGEADDWDELERLFRLYQCEAWVMDAMPEFTKVQEMIRKYPGKAFACQFNKDRAEVGAVRWQEGDKRGYVYADRTKVIDRVVSEINSQDIKFLNKEQDLGRFIYHASNMYRTVETDTKGKIKIDWQTKANRPDHLLFALVYWRIALERAFSGLNSGVVETSSPRAKAPTIIGGKIVVPFDIDASLERAKIR